MSRIENEFKPTRLKILDEAEELFARRGYYGASIHDIAEAVGITKATVMYHFKSKRVLYSSILSRAFQELNENLPPFEQEDVSLASVTNFMKGFYNWVKDNPTHSRLFIRAQLDDPDKANVVARRYYEPIILKTEKLFQKAVQNGLINEMDARMFISIFGGSITNFVVCFSLFENILNKKKTLTGDEVQKDFGDAIDAIIKKTLSP